VAELEFAGGWVSRILPCPHGQGLAELESDLMSQESLVRFSHGLFRFDRLLLLEPYLGA
jgi:hypothetical protein